MHPLTFLHVCSISGSAQNAESSAPLLLAPVSRCSTCVKSSCTKPAIDGGKAAGALATATRAGAATASKLSSGNQLVKATISRNTTRGAGVRGGAGIRPPARAIAATKHRPDRSSEMHGSGSPRLTHLSIYTVPVRPYWYRTGNQSGKCESSDFSGFTALLVAEPRSVVGSCRRRAGGMAYRGGSLSLHGTHALRGAPVRSEGWQRLSASGTTCTEARAVEPSTDQHLA